MTSTRKPRCGDEEDISFLEIPPFRHSGGPPDDHITKIGSRTAAACRSQAVNFLRILLIWKYILFKVCKEKNTENGGS